MKLFVISYQFTTFLLCLLQFICGQIFVDITQESGTEVNRYWASYFGAGATIADLDQDGNMDILVPTPDGEPIKVFHNQGNGTFIDTAEPNGLGNDHSQSVSILVADYDNDGMVDIYVTNNGQQVEDGKGNTINDPYQGVGILYHNETQSTNNWLKIKLEGSKSNRDGYGAKVQLTAGDLVSSQSLISGIGYFSTNAKELYFGLGQNKQIDELEVTWPSGEIQNFNKIASNQTVYIVEGGILHPNTTMLRAKNIPNK